MQCCEKQTQPPEPLPDCWQWDVEACVPKIPLMREELRVWAHSPTWPNRDMGCIPYRASMTGPRAAGLIYLNEAWELRVWHACIGYELSFLQLFAGAGFISLLKWNSVLLHKILEWRGRGGRLGIFILPNNAFYLFNRNYYRKRKQEKMAWYGTERQVRS